MFKFRLRVDKKSDVYDGVITVNDSDAELFDKLDAEMKKYVIQRSFPLYVREKVSENPDIAEEWLQSMGIDFITERNVKKGMAKKSLDAILAMSQEDQVEYFQQHPEQAEQLKALLS